MGKTLIAMSGGVDSSVAAGLAQKQGETCIGATMHLYDDEMNGGEKDDICGSQENMRDARAVAEQLGIPFHEINLTERFHERIIEPFVKEYLQGRTPNPCIECNRHMKFGVLLNLARELGCDKIITGHYARVEKEDSGYVLKKGIDPAKDQSYVLYRLTQEQLQFVRFPLGNYTKEEIRELAEKWGLVSARKKESQDICFVPDGNYAEIIERKSGQRSKEGFFVDKEGNVLGTHRGIIHYTIGQRRGLGISAKEPLYVCHIDTKTNTIMLGYKSELFSRTLAAEDFTWISGCVPESPIKAKAKIRYHHEEQPCIVTPLAPNKVHIEFEEPQRAITPGQSVVVYSEDYVLGGGIIQ